MRLVPVRADTDIDDERHGKFRSRRHALAHAVGNLLDRFFGLRFWQPA